MLRSVQLSMYIIGVCCLIGAGSVEVLGTVHQTASDKEITPIASLKPYDSSLSPTQTQPASPIQSQTPTQTPIATPSPKPVGTQTPPTVSVNQVPSKVVTNLDQPTKEPVKPVSTPTIAVKQSDESLVNYQADKEKWESYKNAMLEQLKSFSDKEPVNLNTSVKTFSSEWDLKLLQLSASTKPKVENDSFDLFGKKMELQSSVTKVKNDIGRLQSLNVQLNTFAEIRRYLQILHPFLRS
ncbi:hypothetical protein M5X11_20120 [Paenibacillus alginolyticus]|uniref:hypothetical protein n=1 Tax=Paenibacillus alginolyticus TaxID=59839 RepID=UPI0003F6E749|nr:hypothetical protein [Paenibacillus alginolyticus]MCY9667212.1 hypothetical protein [Paenibacillus alginolyticus]